MDRDLKSILEARQKAEAGFEAYRKFLGTSPRAIDEMVTAMASAIELEAKNLAEMAVAETGYGNVADKRIKNLFNSLSVSEYLKDVKTLGVLWKDDTEKIMALGEPMGLVVALIPVTNPTSTVIFKILSAIKAGNAIICAPHPRGIRCCTETTRIMNEAAQQLGAPKGLIQSIENVTPQGTSELMKHKRTSIIMATGGPGMVKAAYSCGKPTLAVGAGNVPCMIHESKAAQFGEVANQIVTSKSFDYGTACVSEQAVVTDRKSAQSIRHELKIQGAYFCTQKEADSLSKILFTEHRTIHPDNVGQSPKVLAERAGFSVPPKTKCLVSEETEVGWHRPLSAEKLNPVLAFYETENTERSLDICRQIVEFGGWGHSAVIHSDDPQTTSRFGNLPVGRIIVNTPAILGGMGYSTGLEPSFMLGTGTWSGSITSDNVSALHLINIKRVAYEKRPWRDLFKEYGE